MKKLTGFLCAMVLVFGLVGTANSLSNITALGDLPGGAYASAAWGISSDGTAVVGNALSGLGHEAFRWTQAGGMVGLGDLPGGPFWSSAWGTSSNGTVVVGVSSGASDYEAFRWTQAEGMVGLGNLLLGGGSYSRAFDISSDGSVIVGAGTSTSGHEAFRWTESGGAIGLGDLPGGDFMSDALATSSDGSVVVGRSESAAGTEAFRWTEADGMVGLGVLPVTSDEGAWGTSSDGSVIVGMGTEAFIWDPTYGMRDLKDVLINDYDLDLAGWTLRGAPDISDDGRFITGYGTNPDGLTEAWLADLSHPVPIPSAIWLLGSGLIGLIGFRRKFKEATK